jgi:hypothetical protein
MSAAIWISSAALAVAACSLYVALLAYRAGSPRLTLRVTSRGGGGHFELTVVNSGRAAVGIQGFTLAPHGGGEATSPITHHHVTGESLPYRLEAHASQTWAVNALIAAAEWKERVRAGEIVPDKSQPSLAYFVVEAGNGKRERTTERYDTDRMIAEADPRDVPTSS